MGMTIEQAETICLEMSNTLLLPPYDGTCMKRVNALDMAIETMRKYQKIVQIMERTVDDGTSMYDTLQEIEEVIEDGNVE